VSPTDAPLWSVSRSACGEVDVVGVGEISCDQICEVERLPEPGDKQDLVSLQHAPGGQMATTMLGCARLGLRTRLLAAVGDDSAAEIALRPLRAAGVDLEGVRIVAGGETRTAVILVRTCDGERCVLAHRNARVRIEPAALDARIIEQARALHIDTSDPDAASWAARIARARGIPVVLDADCVVPGLDALLRLVDFPIVSLRCAQDLAGGGAAEDGLLVLLRLGARLAVATRGEDGSLAAQGSVPRWIFTPAFAVEVKDTTGAGDAFRAGFIRALLGGLGAEAALHEAAAVAALNCRGAGAQAGLPDREQLARFLESQAGPKGGGGESQA